MRSLFVLVAVTVAVAACSDDAAPPAPEPGAIQTVCLPEVCVDYPADWDIELAEDFIVFSHPLGSTASVGRVDMRGVVEGAGEVWPADAEATMTAFWALLDDLGAADLQTLQAVSEGVVDSQGKLDGEQLWHRLVVTDPPAAWGAEMRAVDRTWQAHADIITGSLVTVGSS